jgi:CRISPR-associated protein Csb1
MMDLESLLDKKNVALVIKESLNPVEGKESIIYPPTYADIGYNIDPIKKDEKIVGNVCTIDSIGSQANRMEPIFKKEPYKELIPHIMVQIKKKDEVIDEVDILDAGHRIADAVVRFSNLGPEIERAFTDADRGDRSTLARLSPTSLIFGCWDSRGTGCKVPRIVRSTIRAHNVDPLTRSAVYFAPTDYAEAGAMSEKEAMGVEKASATKPAKASTVGLANALANKSHGGVLLSQESLLIKESVLSLSALRQNRVKGDDDATRQLQEYLLGLSLVAITAPQENLLRMGCELTTDPDNVSSWILVKNDGTRGDINLDAYKIIRFAREKANEFGIMEPRTVIFDPESAKKALAKTKD